MTWNSVMGIALLLMSAAAAEAKTDLWLHIKVHDGHDDSRVSVNLPLSVVEAAAPLIPEEARTAESLRVDGRDLSVQDLRRIWREVQRMPDATYVTVEESRGKVRVARSGGYLLIQEADRDRPEGGSGSHGKNVEARIPAAVVDALLQGSGDRFDLAAAIAALARTGAGELVTVNGDHETVRMWVDGDAAGR
ncbi:MAG TPA: hypothetical protein VMW75_16335 [Thermoanaerobaculia bacterium]|nr:hypothetical protein [Thermoanaerobaculia bacterium]